MKQLLSIIALLLILLLPETMTGQGIRITPRRITVHNDSLHIVLAMDLNSVQVRSLAALTFTPVLAGKEHTLPLPAVVVTGKKRRRFELREQALSENSRPAPYRTIRNNRNRGSKEIDYHISIPYASWMVHASLLLRQEMKDCCDLQLLGIDTLTRNIALNVKEQPAVPVKAEQSAPAAIAVITRPLSETLLAAYTPMVSFLTPNLEGNGKQRAGKATLYIDYPLNKYDIFPDFRSNRKELAKIDSILRPVLESNYTTIRTIDICGYASPDGPYGHNEQLSANRSRHFMDYIKNQHSLPQRLFHVTSVAEDWDGLVQLLEQTNPSYKETALRTIARYGIFDGREKQLMELPDNAYKRMYSDLFPLLRRIEVVVNYQVAEVETKDAATLIYSHPEMLSLREMYEVARYYRPGTEQYREVYEIAAFHFPQDVIANVNAASAVMLTGDLKSAWNYLRKVEDDPRAWNNIGVLTQMEGNPKGAAVWFRKAVGVDPVKARRNLEITKEYRKDEEE